MPQFWEKKLFDKCILRNFKYTYKALELNLLKSELQWSLSLELQESTFQQLEILLILSVLIMNKTFGHQSTCEKDVFSSYSSLIPKSKDKTVVLNIKLVIRSDTRWLFFIFY